MGSSNRSFRLGNLWLSEEFEMKFKLDKETIALLIIIWILATIILYKTLEWGGF